MHRPPRRSERAIDVSDSLALLAHTDYGVLSTVGSDGLPYAVPLNYLWRDRVIYLHCAPEGRKLDNIQANPAVSFCVVGKTRTLPGQFSTEYESVVASGTASLVGGDEKKDALIGFLEKYSLDFIAPGLKYLAGKIDAVSVVRIDVDHLCGKARR